MRLFACECYETFFFFSIQRTQGSLQTIRGISRGGAGQDEESCHTASARQLSEERAQRVADEVIAKYSRLAKETEKLRASMEERESVSVLKSKKEI